MGIKFARNLQAVEKKLPMKFRSFYHNDINYATLSRKNKGERTDRRRQEKKKIPTTKVPNRNLLQCSHYLLCIFKGNRVLLCYQWTEFFHLTCYPIWPQSSNLFSDLMTALF